MAAIGLMFLAAYFYERRKSW